MSQIADATDRLSYVVEMTEKAANRTMDLVEQSAPLVNQLGDDSRELHQEWQRFMRREIDADGFRELAKRIEQFLVRSGGTPASCPRSSMTSCWRRITRT